MQFLEPEIVRITEDVWSMILGLPAQRSPQLPETAGARTVSGTVRIQGAWDGVVSLRCAEPLARRATAIMFGLGGAEASPAQNEDAIGELTNMLGGNVKGLLPEPCRLSLPTVVEDTGYSVRVPARARVRTEVSFECQGQPFVVTLLESEPGGS
jgi:chemotaxis protein CheX